MLNEELSVLYNMSGSSFGSKFNSAMASVVGAASSPSLVACFQVEDSQGVMHNIQFGQSQVFFYLLNSGTPSAAVMQSNLQQLPLNTLNQAISSNLGNSVQVVANSVVVNPVSSTTGTSSGGGSGLSGGAIAGIVIGVIVGLCLLLLLVVYCFLVVIRNRKSAVNKSADGVATDASMGNQAHSQLEERAQEESVQQTTEETHRAGEDDEGTQEHEEQQGEVEMQTV